MVDNIAEERMYRFHRSQKAIDSLIDCIFTELKSINEQIDFYMNDEDTTPEEIQELFHETSSNMSELILSINLIPTQTSLAQTLLFMVNDLREMVQEHQQQE